MQTVNLQPTLELTGTPPVGSSERVRPTATSEEIYGITKQPPPTCPLIDEALKEVERCQKRIMRYEKSDEDELRDMLSDVESNLGSVSGYGKSGLLEDIRERVEAIRAWGEEWKQLALEHAPKPDETESAQRKKMSHRRLAT